MLTGTPLDLTPFGAALQGIGVLYWLFVLGVIAIILFTIDGWWWKIVCIVLALVCLVLPVAYYFYLRYQEQQVWKSHMDKVQAQFQLRCQSSGEKIYRTVDDVEGILLRNVRPDEQGTEVEDPNWPDAALAHERQANGYIEEFLGWEHHEDKRESRGYVTSDPRPQLRYMKQDVLPGYRFVDVIDDEHRIFRYKYQAIFRDLSKDLVTGRVARYSVELVNFIDPDDRKLWIAGVKITVKDEETKEILAEKIRYVYEPGQGSLAHARQPWRFALLCPNDKLWPNTSVRFFVDQVLKPKKD
ncbi:hypothetical protein [Undibacterium fentianense]|uniref:Uncharacterized protein n=1 Tax=Undibacterium fentianense TaxID=2828728 RepID=A0A941E1H3_9BURK|nr:hypothetical protein [Undibacterium fentianense]MBR7798914.1 hypothetical protein [Undibacterium fentianense]